MHGKPEEPGSAKADHPEQLEASNSVTSVVTPLLEKTDNMLASWGLTNSASGENVAAVQVGIVLQHSVCILSFFDNCVFIRSATQGCNFSLWFVVSECVVITLYCSIPCYHGRILT